MRICAGHSRRTPADWYVVDKGIDRALEALRADHYTAAAECKQAPLGLLKTMDTMSGKN
jgi:hypothetical protein